MSARDAPRPLVGRRAGTWAVFVGLVALGALLAWRGADFYALGLVERVEHPDYRALRPSGSLGHGYGIAGTLLILTNLLYLARRRFAAWQMGSMRWWLDLHVFSGLGGALLVLFHSAFQVRTPIAMVTSGSLVLVVLTGVVGRFLYALAPRPAAARTRTVYEAMDSLAPGVADRIREALAALPRHRLGAGASLGAALAAQPAFLREARARRRAVTRAAAASSGALGPDAARRLRGYVAEARLLAGREATSEGAGALLRSWRGMHRALAILLVLIVPSHIGISLYYGYRWIFSG